ncbi:hypothetical protein BGZ58_001621 [Dissophora ornata]|nr:hypothetical protein BGZ58_001621 [Dissophora ornata]
MQERYQAQQEPGWLRTQHALLQAKHRIPGSGSPQSDHKNSFGGRKSGLIPGAQPFLSRIHSSSSSPNSSDYSSSPSFYLGPQQARQAQSGGGSSQRHQTIQPFNCFQPGNVICVPRERSLGGLIFHKTFVYTHILTPSPYYRGQYLTLDNKVVEIDKDYVREISGFVHPRSVKILSEETVYNGSSKKATRVLVLERPLEGDGVVLSRLFDGPVLPSLRQYSNDMTFLESLPELSRALRDFNNLCLEFENTYIYIRGFAAHTLEKLRLIYEKTHRDCIGDSVKLQKMLSRGIQFEQDTFAELMENVVLGKLYQKLFIHSLVPCYAQRDVEIDAVIEKYHRYLFGPGAHRGIDGGECLAATDGPVLRDTLKKLGLSEKWRTMRFDHVLEGAAGLFRAWDQESHNGPSGPFSSSSGQTREAMSHFEETEQERKRRQLRESLRIFVQDDKYKSGMQAATNGADSCGEEAERQAEDEDEEDPTANAVWNTPLEKTSCIKLVMDTIATVAEDHLMNGQGFGYVQKKRSEVAVTTDDFIPLLAIVIIQARMMSLGSNLFYMQRFRINAPKSDLSFALVTFEASVEFLKTDPLGLLDTEQTPPLRPSSTSISPVSRNSMQGSLLRMEVDQRNSTEEIRGLPWGTPSHTGWGFSPPKISADTATFAQSTSSSEKNIFVTPVEYSPSRPPLSSRMSNDYSQQQYQQRHARSASMNFDDRFRRVAQGEDCIGGSSNNSSWSRSPMLGPRFTSGTSSPLGVTPSSYGVLPSSSETSSGSLPRRPSYQLQQMPQRHSISSGQGLLFTHAQQNHHKHRISVDQGRETMSRSTILPLQSPNMTPQLVVKPQIMLPPPKTPPMSGQNTSGRARPMSMVMAGALSSSGYSSSYGGSGSGISNVRRSFSSNHSSPATSPRLGPGMGMRPSSSRSNSLMAGPFPMMRANSANTVITANELSHANGTSASAAERTEQGEPLSPLSPMSPWVSKLTLQPPSPSLLNELPVTTEDPTSFAAGVSIPQTPETPRRQQNNRIPGRIRTSPSSTVSSISTPTTPSTFSSASASALLDSLNANSQLSSPLPGPPPFLKSTHPLDLATPNSSSAPSSAAGSMRSQSSGSRQNSIRSSLPRLSLSPSAPSTAFCKTTVTAAVTHATTSVDNLEPTSTVLAMDLYGPGTNATMTVTPATPILTTVQGGRNSIGSRETVGSGAGTHQKVDSGKYVGHHLGGHSHKNTSTSSNSSTISNTSSSGNGNIGSVRPNGTKRYSYSTTVDHFSQGTPLDLGRSFHEELFFDAQQQIPDRRRGSTISLKGAKSISNFQPEKTILVWNQHHIGSIVDSPGSHGNHGSHGAGPVGSRINRLSMSNGDLPSASSPAASMKSYSRPHTPMASSFVIDDMQQQQRTREMMGDFLSELAKVEDGDVLVGNGRDGVMSRQ